jgi:hypothetical protein
MRVTMGKFGFRLWLVASLGVLLLATACADVKPFEYTEIHEIQPGPGLLSGEDGEFVLYRN